MALKHQISFADSGPNFFTDILKIVTKTWPWELKLFLTIKFSKLGNKTLNLCAVFFTSAREALISGAGAGLL
jgi:hypothetical protein